MTLNPGLFFGMFANVWWGLSALYWHQLAHIDAIDVLAHRALWALPVLVLMLAYIGTVRKTCVALMRDPKLLGIMAMCAVLISINWGVFVYASGHGQLVQSSLGYFLLPLASVVFGLVFFGETLDRIKIIALGLAAIGVSVSIVSAGGLSWTATVIVLSFSAYSALRKAVSLGAVEGLFVETLLLAPIAAVWLLVHAGGGLSTDNISDTTLLLLAGVVTVLPLVGYVAATRRLTMFTVGMMFYVNPALQFLVGWGLFGEDFTVADALTFGFVLAGLAVYSADRYFHYMKNQRQAA